MKALYSTCFLIYFAAKALAEPAPFRLSIDLPKESTHVLSAPIKVEIAIRNVSGKEQLLPNGLWFFSGKTCGPLLYSGPVLVGEHGERPQGEPIKAPPNWQQVFEYDLQLTCGINKIGKYQFEYRYGPDPFSKSANTLQLYVNIVEPTGTDKLAYEMLQTCYSSNAYISSGECYAPVLAKFPGSIYSLWFVFDYLERADNRGPSLIKKMIAEGFYPHANLLPDQISGKWRAISDGKPAAEWHLFWAKKILKAHPSFRYRNRLKIILGLSQLVVGNPRAAVKSLKEVDANTKEGQWAKSFLSIL